MKKTTNEIENELKCVKTNAELKQYMEDNSIGQFQFGSRFSELCKEYGVKQADLVYTVAVSKSQLYAVINGTRNPSKELVIKLALALKLTIEEINELLKLAGHKELYVENKADSIIIYGLKENKTVYEIEELLKEYQVDFTLTDEE